ncbi:prostaglandin E synthase [Aethina tumida]|uniref:prostaglandin E synthase n=1 Tax=Aethina tumida TaxID=116153 RepID=UPI002148E64C|nr:prostaglandin E synthase [Aethina tumida]
MWNYTTDNVLSTANPAFCSYLICVNLLILKMMGLTLLTILQRMRDKVFISAEDAAWMNGEVKDNETVARTRRTFQNDLENIPVFFLASLAYLFTNPPLWVVNLLFIVFLVTRTLHSFVYAIYVMRQPTRATLWAVGFAITGYMAIHSAIHAFVIGYIP